MSDHGRREMEELLEGTHKHEPSVAIVDDLTIVEWRCWCGAKYLEEKDATATDSDSSATLDSSSTPNS